MSNMNRIEIEKRDRDFRYASQGAGTAFYAACSSLLREAGWQWMNSNRGGGWWILPDSENAYPMGDAKEFHFQAFQTARLYAEIAIESVLTRTAEFQQDARSRIYGS